MKIKIIKLTFLLLLNPFVYSYSQDSPDLKTNNNMTFYYVDNSGTDETGSLNNEIVQVLKGKLSMLSGSGDNYFFFYGCNGDAKKVSNNITSFLEGSIYKKFFQTQSKESDYQYDKQEIRDFFTDYPVRIKQNVQINMYLSTFAIKKMIKNIDDLPTPIVFPNELLVYLNAKDLKVKIYIYINKEAIDLFGEEKIKSYFTFCNAELGSEKVTPTIEFL